MFHDYKDRHDYWTLPRKSEKCMGDIDAEHAKYNNLKGVLLLKHAVNEKWVIISYKRLMYYFIFDHGTLRKKCATSPFLLGFPFMELLMIYYHIIMLMMI